MSADDKENPAATGIADRAKRQETDEAISHKKPRPARRKILRLSDLRAAIDRVNVDAQSDVLSDDLSAALDDEERGQ